MNREAGSNREAVVGLEVELSESRNGGGIISSTFYKV